MKKIFIALIIALSITTTQTAFACKPGPTIATTQKEMATQKDVVFIGTVQSVIQDTSINADYRVSFTINKAYKGLTSTTTATVVIASSSAACGYDNGYDTFKPGSVWIINANGTASSGYTTNSLSLNTQYNSVALAETAMVAAQLSIGVGIKDESPIMCTMQYAPVCGKKDTIKTYGNSCMLGADKAEYLYEGECKTNTAASTSTTAPSVQNTATVGASVDAETTVDVGPIAVLSVWQKIVIGFKSFFSFLK